MNGVLWLECPVFFPGKQRTTGLLQITQVISLRISLILAVSMEGLVGPRQTRAKVFIVPGDEIFQ